MLQYIARRLLYMIPTLLAISVLTFLVIQAPPGDYLTTVVAKLEAEGQYIVRAQLDALRNRYGLDESIWVQYWRWIKGIVLNGDFGRSFVYSAPAAGVLTERFGISVLLSVTLRACDRGVAVRIGLYSARHG